MSNIFKLYIIFSFLFLAPVDSFSKAYGYPDDYYIKEKSLVSKMVTENDKKWDANKYPNIPPDPKLMTPFTGPVTRILGVTVNGVYTDITPPGCTSAGGGPKACNSSANYYATLAKFNVGYSGKYISLDASKYKEGDVVAVKYSVHDNNCGTATTAVFRIVNGIPPDNSQKKPPGVVTVKSCGTD